MSVEPPSSGRPTGPPSGPLSGPSQPPKGPPSQPPPTGGGSSAGPPGPGRRPWWRSVPGIAAIAAAVAAAVILTVVFTRSDGGGTSDQAAGGEVFLQSASAEGPDPFTESTAEDTSVPTVTPSAPTGSASANAVRTVDGGAPGLYGGTQDAAACDVEQQIRYLKEVPAKNEAFADVADVTPGDVPGYLRSLTPLQLRMDTRVTNHGYRDGAATQYQAVLQAGTAVLVDDRGVPRVRCACGNPLTEPVAQSSPRHTGKPWPGFNASNTVVVEPSDRPVKKFVVRDSDGGWFERNPGDKGGKDRPTEPPDHQSPSTGPTTPTSPHSDGTTTPPDGPTTPTGPPTTGTAPDNGDTTPTGEPPASESSAPPPPPPASDTPESAGSVSAPPVVSS